MFRNFFNRYIPEIEVEAEIADRFLNRFHNQSIRPAVSDFCINSLKHNLYLFSHKGYATDKINVANKVKEKQCEEKTMNGETIVCC